MRNVLFSKADNKHTDENAHRSSAHLGQILFRGVFLIFALIVTVWVARADAATTHYFGRSAIVIPASVSDPYPIEEQTPSRYFIVDCAVNDNNLRSPRPVIRFTPSPQHSIQSTFAVAKCGYRQKKKFAVQEWQ